MSDNSNFKVPKLTTFGHRILVDTKSDLKGKRTFKADVSISVKDNRGIEELINLIIEKFKTMSPKDTSYLTNRRHFEGVKLAYDSLIRAQDYDFNKNPELLSEDLRLAAISIGKLTNIIDVEEVLDDIFSSFCIGK